MGKQAAYCSAQKQQRGLGVNLTETAVEHIRELMIERRLKPGDAFATEGELEERLGVSRPVLREAISRLRAIGLLESRQGKGLIAAKPDPVGLFGDSLQGRVLESLELQELAELRYTLEIGAVELVVKRATEDQLLKLQALADEYAATSDQARGDQLDLEFHLTILNATQSTMLRRMHRVLTRYFHRGAHQIADWRDAGTWSRHREESAWEHLALARAFGERSAEQARAFMTGHLAVLLRLQEERS